MIAPSARLTRLADPAQPTLEAADLNLAHRGATDVPPLFLDQLVHVFLRHLLAGCDDPIRLRAAELLFREQKVTIQDGAIMLADEETVEMHAAGAATGPHVSWSRAEPCPKTVELDVLDEHTPRVYRARDRFDTVLDLSFARPGLDALCRVLEA